MDMICVHCKKQITQKFLCVDADKDIFIHPECKKAYYEFKHRIDQLVEKRSYNWIYS